MDFWCQGKLRYANKGAAVMVLKKRTQRRLKPLHGQKLEAYHCSKCHGWHLGTAHRDAPSERWVKRKLALRRIFRRTDHKIR